MKRLLPLIALLIALGGCQEVQSVMSPGATGAAQIAQLAWLLFGLSAAIFLLVLAALWVALRGPVRMRTHLADSRAVVVGGIVFPTIVLTALLGYSVWLLRGSIPHSSATGVVRIGVVGEQWWWRVSYIRPGALPVASANEIRIPVGVEVEFTLNSADVIHSFWIPSLGGKVDMTPGRTTKLRVKAERVGIYRGQCAEYCGGPHAFMGISVLAMPSGEFIEWLQVESRGVTEATAEPSRSGQALFLAAGCGSCHAVRGTTAAGVLGPDLTRLGSRRSIAAERLPMSRENLARFITDGQHLKPGNRMPPFRIFSNAELETLTAYLASLR